jgi:hypothetical protein
MIQMRTRSREYPTKDFCKMKEKVTAESKPRKCPKCGCKKIADILYGMPAFSPELRKDLDEGITVLGGCCAMDNGPGN